MSCVDPERKSFKVAESLYLVWLTKQEVLKLRSLYIMCGSPKKKFYSFGVYMSCVDPERKSFKVVESIYHVWLTKREVLKFWCLYVMCGSRKKEF